MKNLILLVFIITISVTSCKKSKTCTCKSASGSVVSSETKKSYSKITMEEFEENCKKKKTDTYGSNGFLIASIPCKIE
ncbi:MAG: hypothetical protein Q8L81_09270 [Bacteroidota bacterium]|nr:hypothetical protein [Bacteroidota bacterium]